MASAGAVVLGLGLDAGEIERHRIVVERPVFRLRQLPEAFAGMRIAQISDLHYAEFTEPAFLRKVVERVNELAPDMVLLTGDFVSMDPIATQGARPYAWMCAELLRGLRCPERYGSLGNHDAMVGPELVCEAMRSAGVRMLVNESVPLERAGGRIWLSGVGSALSNFCHIQASVPPHAIADGEPVLMMAHEPDIWDEIARYGVDLVLSGHTHAGQVRLPFLPPMLLPPMGERYVEGHFQRGRSQLYVNRGVGSVGLPLRFRCTPEVTLMTLERG